MKILQFGKAVVALICLFNYISLVLINMPKWIFYPENISKMSDLNSLY